MGDLEGNTPLHLASKRGYLECAEALLRSISTEELKEACVNASSSHLSLHKILDTKNYQGEHSVHLATFGKHYNFIRFLCWSGADMNATEGRSGKTCLHYAVNKRDLNLVGLLASKKALGGCEVDLNTRDWCGRTPLLCAIINGDFTGQLCSARCRSGDSQRVGTTHGASRLPLVVLRYNRYGPVGKVHSAPTSSSVIFVKIPCCLFRCYLLLQRYIQFCIT